MSKYTVQYMKQTADLSHFECGCPTYTEVKDEDMAEYNRTFYSLENAQSGLLAARVTYTDHSATIHYAEIRTVDEDGTKRVLYSTLSDHWYREYRETILAVAFLRLQTIQDRNEA